MFFCRSPNVEALLHCVLLLAHALLANAIYLGSAFHSPLKTLNTISSNFQAHVLVLTHLFNICKHVQSGPCTCIPIQVSLELFRVKVIIINCCSPESYVTM